jgi:hypothetical protein
MIELVGSKVAARRSSDIDLLSQDDTDDDEAMPNRDSRAPTEDVDTDPYQTPVALTPANRKNKARVMAEPVESSESDIEMVERSDVEVVTIGELKKRRALISAANVCL